MRKIITSIGNKLAYLEVLFMKICMAGLTIVVVLHIVTRNLGLYISWSYDVSMLLFYWLVFVGAALGIRNGSHYTIDIWNSGYLIRFKRQIVLFSAVVTAILISIFIWQGFKMAWLGRGRTSGAAEIGMLYYSVSLPVGSILGLFHLIEATFKDLELLGRKNQ